MGDWVKLRGDDGVVVPLAVYKPEDTAKAVFLLLPALGVKAKFYKRVAKSLAAQGIATVLFEQRGHGESPYRPARGEMVGYRDYLGVDIPLAISWVKESFPDVPLFTGGHSLGAHMGNYMAAERPDDIAGLIHMACVFPYKGFFSRKEALQLGILCSLIPPLTRLLGYYPGEWFGFGSKEYRHVMLDWREWALTGNYDFSDIRGVESRMATYNGPLLSISFEKDVLASEGALNKPHAVMQGATVSKVHLTEKEQGKHIGHFDWARKPDGVVATITEWIETCLT